MMSEIDSMAAFYKLHTTVPSLQYRDIIAYLVIIATFLYVSSPNLAAKCETLINAMEGCARCYLSHYIPPSGRISRSLPCQNLTMASCHPVLQGKPAHPPLA